MKNTTQSLAKFALPKGNTLTTSHNFVKESGGVNIPKLANYYALPVNDSALPNREQLDKGRADVLAAQSAAAAQGTKVSPNSNVIKHYKSLLPMVLPVNIFSVLLGHMLGDCCVKYNASKDQAYMSFEWGNKSYAWFVYNMLSDYVLSAPRVQIRVNALGNTVTTYCFQTVTLPSFAVFHHLFIERGVKTVPIGLIQYLLTPLALAIWFMDDGGQTDYRKGHGHGVQLNTQGFTLEAVSNMVKELNDKYNLDCWMRILQNKGGKPIIVIPSKSYPKFHSLVKEHIDSSMMHKLPAPKGS